MIADPHGELQSVILYQLYDFLNSDNLIWMINSLITCKQTVSKRDLIDTTNEIDANSKKAVKP